MKLTSPSGGDHCQSHVAGASQSASLAHPANVSVQKSAVGALVQVAARGGDDAVARVVASLPPERRRRVAARIGHQAPGWVARLRDALGALPHEAYAAAASPSEPAKPRARPERDTEAIVRFRKWLASLPLGGEDS